MCRPTTNLRHNRGQNPPQNRAKLLPHPAPAISSELASVDGQNRAVEATLQVSQSKTVQTTRQFGPDCLRVDDFPERLAALLHPAPFHPHRSSADRRIAGNLDHGNAVFPDGCDRGLSLCPPADPPSGGTNTDDRASCRLGHGAVLLAACHACRLAVRSRRSRRLANAPALRGQYRAALLRPVGQRAIAPVLVRAKWRSLRLRPLFPSTGPATLGRCWRFWASPWSRSHFSGHR